MNKEKLGRRFRSTRREMLKLDYKNKMKNKNLTILGKETSEFENSKNSGYLISPPPTRPSKLFMGNFVRGNIHKIDKIKILKNKKSHENSSNTPKMEKSVAFFSPNSWHEFYKEKELNMNEVVKLRSENE